jgi:ubiquinone/menaquinone biosynthesis C-methylase UbiE
MTNSKSRYIPALSFRGLTPLYDPLLRWGMREQAFKRRIVEQANIQPEQEVLDLGCGTGTLTLMLKRSAPAASITGLDGDKEVLARARSKAKEAGIDIRWDEGMAYELPYPERSFDIVVSSLVIHHLIHADKLRAFREAGRVLRPGGKLWIMDFGPPYNLLTRAQVTIMKDLEEAADNFQGRILPMLREAGFPEAREVEHMNTIFGPIWLYEAPQTKQGR